MQAAHVPGSAHKTDKSIRHVSEASEIKRSAEFTARQMDEREMNKLFEHVSHVEPKIEDKEAEAKDKYSKPFISQILDIEHSNTVKSWFDPRQLAKLGRSIAHLSGEPGHDKKVSDKDAKGINEIKLNFARLVALNEELMKNGRYRGTINANGQEKRIHRPVYNTQGELIFSSLITGEAEEILTSLKQQLIDLAKSPETTISWLETNNVIKIVNECRDSNALNQLGESIFYGLSKYQDEYDKLKKQYEIDKQKYQIDEKKYQQELLKLKEKKSSKDQQPLIPPQQPTQPPFKYSVKERIQALEEKFKGKTWFGYDELQNLGQTILILERQLKSETEHQVKDKYHRYIRSLKESYCKLIRINDDLIDSGFYIDHGKTDALRKAFLEERKAERPVNLDREIASKAEYEDKVAASKQKEIRKRTVEVGEKVEFSDSVDDAILDGIFSSMRAVVDSLTKAGDKTVKPATVPSKNGSAYESLYSIWDFEISSHLNQLAHIKRNNAQRKSDAMKVQNELVTVEYLKMRQERVPSGASTESPDKHSPSKSSLSVGDAESKNGSKNEAHHSDSDESVSSPSHVSSPSSPSSARSDDGAQSEQLRKQNEELRHQITELSNRLTGYYQYVVSAYKKEIAQYKKALKKSDETSELKTAEVDQARYIESLQIEVEQLRAEYAIKFKAEKQDKAKKELELINIQAEVEKLQKLEQELYAARSELEQLKQKREAAINDRVKLEIKHHQSEINSMEEKVKAAQRQMVQAQQRTIELEREKVVDHVIQGVMINAVHHVGIEELQDELQQAQNEKAKSEVRAFESEKALALERESHSYDVEALQRAKSTQEHITVKEKLATETLAVERLNFKSEIEKQRAELEMKIAEARASIIAELETKNASKMHELEEKYKGELSEEKRKADQERKKTDEEKLKNLQLKAKIQENEELIARLQTPPQKMVVLEGKDKATAGQSDEDQKIIVQLPQFTVTPQKTEGWTYGLAVGFAVLGGLLIATGVGAVVGVPLMGFSLGAAGGATAAIGGGTLLLGGSGYISRRVTLDKATHPPQKKTANWKKFLAISLVVVGAMFTATGIGAALGVPIGALGVALGLGVAGGIATAAIAGTAAVAGSVYLAQAHASDQVKDTYDDAVKSVSSSRNKSPIATSSSVIVAESRTNTVVYNALLSAQLPQQKSDLSSTPRSELIASADVVNVAGLSKLSVLSPVLEKMEARSHEQTASASILST